MPAYLSVNPWSSGTTWWNKSLSSVRLATAASNQQSPKHQQINNNLTNIIY